MRNVKWWEEQPRLWEKLVPKSGRAETIQGELIRCIGKATDEAYRNGNINWKSGYRELVLFVRKVLDDADTFSSSDRKKIREAADSVIKNYQSPDTSGHGSPYYYLAEMAVYWCLAHPKPILRIPAKETVKPSEDPNEPKK